MHSLIDELMNRFNGGDLVERYRGKKIMLVGDSLSNNMWQSLTCMLHGAVPNSNYTLTTNHSLSTFLFHVSISYVTLNTTLILIFLVVVYFGFYIF